MNTELVKDYLRDLQRRIVAELERLDGRAFKADTWQRPEGGGGETRVIEEGGLFERGGVNFSHVLGERLPPSASASRPELAGRGFEAMGVSLVLHARNPYVPTVHMNVRFFLATKPGSDAVWWFGGGMDLTPSPEMGTGAFTRFETVSPAEKEARRAEIMAVQAEISRARNGSYVGQALDVLIEQRVRPGRKTLTGRTRFQAPEVDGRVLLSVPRAAPGPWRSIVRAEITSAGPYDLRGRLVP